MSVIQAWKIIGNQPRWAIKNMVKARGMFAAIHTPEETRRLRAARICLKNPNPRYI